MPPCMALRHFGEALKLESCSLDHLLQVGDEFGIHWVVGSMKRVQRRSACGVQDPKHAHLLKARLVDTPVFPATATTETTVRKSRPLTEHLVE
jgi:hypothetical protein